MGKNEFLDITDQPWVVEQMKLTVVSLIFAILLVVFVSGCSLPRIIVLEDPLSPAEHLNLGVTYEKNHEFDAALKEYRAAANKIPLAYVYMGNVFFQRVEFDKAEHSYRKAIQKNDKIADAYNNLAWLFYVQRKNLEEAEWLALKAIELDATQAQTYRDTLENIKGLRHKPSSHSGPQPGSR